MKNPWHVACFLLLGLAMAAWAGQGKLVKVRVDGLSCPFCAYGLEKKLKKIDGVEKLEIKINEGVVYLHYRENAAVDTVLLAQKVKEAGFTPRQIELVSPAVTDGGRTEKKIALAVEGMTCEDCVRRVEKALQSVPCARDVQVDRKRARAELVCSGDATDAALFVKKVEALGFKARVLENKPAESKTARRR